MLVALALMVWLSLAVSDAGAATTPTLGVGFGSTGAAGPGNPYPSAVEVSGLAGTVSKLTVRMDLSNATLSDFDVLLVGPQGQKVMLMSDMPGNPINDSVTFDDAAPAFTGPFGATGFWFKPFDQEPGDTLPEPAPPGPYSSSLSAFAGTDPNGTWRLYAVDDCEPLVCVPPIGFAGIAWNLHIATASATNPAAITIPGDGTGSDTGSPASPYPSQITVSGLGGQIVDTTVRLHNLGHYYAADIDLLLVGPAGQKVMLMSDAGQAGVYGATITFDDGARFPVSDTGIRSASYKPTNLLPTEIFPGVSGATFGTALAVFNSGSPNGVWSLYAIDDEEGDSGAIYGGWSLSFSLTPGSPPEPQQQPGPTPILGTPPPPPPPPDTTAPALRLSGATVQRILRQRGVLVVVTCPAEVCTATAKGKVVVRGSAKVYKLRPATKQIAKGAKATLKLKLKRSALKPIGRALKAGKRVSARVAVTAKDAAGNVTTKRRTIRLKR